ncbi:lipase family protein [Thalassolituus sp.]|uniref:lipase family protein n=1 Tax=Thalassolituus sp. TaxID=2030822 RepID=UPI00263685AB|nr:lipase family protein [Thalassolituus sp.]
MSDTYPPTLAARLADDIYGLVTGATLDDGYRVLHKNHHKYLDLPEPPEQEIIDQKVIPLLKGTTGSVFFLKSQSAMGLTAFGNGMGYEKHAFIVFRGTNTKFAADILTDLSVGITLRSSYGQPIHNGFADAFSSMKNQIDIFLAECVKRNTLHLHIVGHSLGGALATLCTEYAKSKYSTLAVKCYTFGSPRVGLKSFSDEFTRKIGPENIFRAYHRTDLIPCIPCWPFMHIPITTGANSDYFLPSEGNFAALAAHDMKLYRDSVKGHNNWDGLRGLRYQNLQPTEIKPWLNNKSPISFTPTNLEYLDKAINYVLLKVAKGIGSAVGAGLTGSFTLLDQMAYILRKGIDLSTNLSTLVLSLLRKIAELLGMRKTIEVADATLVFIRNLFQRLHQKVSEQAQKILDAVLVRGKSL